MGSFMTDPKALAEKIYLLCFGKASVRGIETGGPLPDIESLLREAMEENLKTEIKERLGLLETVKIRDAKAAAYLDAAKIAESNKRDWGKTVREIRCRTEGL